MSKLPKHYTEFLEKYPKIGETYRALGDAVSSAGPLDAKTKELVKLALAIGNRQEGGVHSHTRRALEAGATKDEIRHTVLLSLTTIGFPNMMAALSWVEDVLEKD